MTILGVPLYAAAIAGAVAWLVGAIWYGVLGKAWIEALGTTREALMGPSGRPGAGPFIFAYIADCILALTIGVVTGGVSGGHPSPGIGMAVAFVLWFGCVFTTLSVNNGYAKRNSRLTMIDAGHWLFAMLAAGAVIGALPME